MSTRDLDVLLNEIRRIDELVQSITRDIVRTVAEGLRQQAPVRTGMMRELIDWSWYEDFGYIQVSRPFILWLESGSLPPTGMFRVGRRVRYRRTGFQPYWFLRRTLFSIGIPIDRVLDEHLRRWPR